MYNYKYQQGLSSIGWLCVILVVVFLGLCAFKMVPAYVENQYVKTALRNLVDGPENLNEMSTGQIRQELNSFYTMNNVRGEAVRHLDVDRQRDRTLISVNYEVRVPLFSNIAVVMTFNNVLDSSRPQACCKPRNSGERE